MNHMIQSSGFLTSMSAKPMVNPVEKQGLTPTLKMDKTNTPEEIWEASLKYEKQFISSFLQHYMKSVCQDQGLMGGGDMEMMFRNQWTEKIADSMVGNFGLAEGVYRQLLKQQEIPHDAA